MTQIPVSTNKFGNKPKPQSMEDFIGGAPSVVREPSQAFAPSMVSEPLQVQPVAVSEPVVEFESKMAIPEGNPPFEPSDATSVSNRPKKYNKAPKVNLVVKSDERENGSLQSIKILVGVEQEEALRKLSYETKVSKSRMIRESLDDWFAKNGIKLPDAEAK